MPDSYEGNSMHISRRSLLAVGSSAVIVPQLETGAPSPDLPTVETDNDDRPGLYGAGLYSTGRYSSQPADPSPPAHETGDDDIQTDDDSDDEPPADDADDSDGVPGIGTAVVIVAVGGFAYVLAKLRRKETTDP